ncbi:hypothetical protein G6F57_001772 [Rhizopus arrhizus]|uniref:DNA repair metallo-beta-lactamase domain-containing protein n=1 Tax=Rhizopus oryzae TaxID=64495 RepID=A0A9P6XHQ0_RHIOR|nr:hypothetical protein G6F23_004104 [Rhizopus arrhizus]KAG1429209.1 hypothetical protein G6F58_000161 [Rhizopus delemar]KAG0768841.1 hypothetical protein G6F24_001594 [Rhizopus arrhizus]KAG0795723.1 hypothetical protein G6F21_001888 [Rhizopus arrhizus]KAG0800430.1 hypothetical protein G6F22_002241 [Rhizopus arrhizus]
MNNNKKKEVRSKYFPIDSYFKSPKPKLQNQNEQHLATSLQKTESCPICNTVIYIESVSMEVHINTCLDAQELSPPSLPSLTPDTSEPSSLSSASTTVDIAEFSFLSYSSLKTDTEETSSGVATSEKDKENKNDEELKRVLPSSWKSLFSCNTPIKKDILAPKNTNSFKAKALSKSKQGKVKTCPFYKRVKDTQFVVDAFNYGDIPGCDGYFLSHFHTDHYGGLRSNWSHGPIYCSQVTANLIKQELKVDPRFIHPLPMDELYPIPQSNVKVALIDANHCPGSVLFLFVVERADKTVVRHLHTGDFRAAPRMCLHPLVRQPDNPSIQCLYLDTTYLNPQYAFPAQEECIQAVCDTIEKEILKDKKKNTLNGWLAQTGTNAFNMLMQPKPKKQTLIVVGTYTVGKERVFFKDKELQSMITENPSEAQVHVVSLRDIRADIMANYLWDLREHFESLIAFKPTGWTYKSTNTEATEMKHASLSYVITPPSDRSLNLIPFYDSRNIKMYGVPYSEHSSYRELASFIASLDIKEIIPTVNTTQKDKQLHIMDRWQQDKLAKRVEVVAFSNENYW